MLQMVESATCNYKYFELKTLTLCGKKHSEGVFMMRKISKYLFFWALGGALYYTFEILFRGFSHWSMYVLGGICFVFLYSGREHGMAGTCLETDASLYRICNGRGIHYRNHRK